MSRNHATRKNPPRQATAPAWVWLLTGSVLGAFIMFLVYLRDVPSQPNRVFNVDKQAAEQAGETSKESDEEVPKPRFVFYELLKESEVEVEPPEETPGESSPLTPPSQNVEYILQAGSFQDRSEADRLRAQLILHNLDARVDKKLIGNQTWHRVIVGPFQSRAMASKARGTLASIDVDSIMREQQK